MNYNWTSQFMDPRIVKICLPIYIIYNHPNEICLHRPDWGIGNHMSSRLCWHGTDQFRSAVDNNNNSVVFYKIPSCWFPLHLGCSSNSQHLYASLIMMGCRMVWKRISHIVFLDLREPRANTCCVTQSARWSGKYVVTR